ncbi:MAG: TolC family protein [Pirellulaceae bacterium]|jgi:outer membrane protein TolC|nr:TolC family protein [Pirellulaceae bacterium]
MSLSMASVRWGIVLSLIAVSGCALVNSKSDDCSDCADCDMAAYKTVASQIEYPDICTPIDELHARKMAKPITIREDAPPEPWQLSLEEAMRLALENSVVLRDLGGLVLQSPETVRTVHTPAIQESDPRFGMEAALSAFDTSFEAAAFFENNERALNNSFFGGGTRLLKQDFNQMYAQLVKRSVGGGDFTIRHNIEYDSNNAPGNQFGSAWDVNVEGEFRQPLLQGAGVDFNRIAGPSSIPGQYRGVLIARANADISLTEFEAGVRDLVSDVENAYWELYYAYRDLDAKLAARDRALATWRVVNEWYRRGREGGEADKEAQAREQYYRLEEDVQNALTGRIIEPSRNNTFRGTGGVHATERRLRQILGVTVNDGKLIRPSDEPQMARVLLNWDEILVESQVRRPELRRQKWLIKRRELELLAAKNFLMPRFDAVGRYRWRGFGHDLLDPNRAGKPAFNDAYGNLSSGDFTEWQLGVELTVPIGYRQAHAGVRNAELNLARDVAVLEEQQRAVAHDLSAAVGEMERAYVVSQTAYNRMIAGRQQLRALEVLYEDPDPSQVARLIDQMLDAQRRLADSETRYYRSLIEYTIAIKNVHYNKGSLLDYNEVFLSEGSWPSKAYGDAAERERTMRHPWRLANFMQNRHPPRTISQGEYPQQTTPGGGLPYPTMEPQAPPVSNPPEDAPAGVPPGVTPPTAPTAARPFPTGQATPRLVQRRQTPQPVVIAPRGSGNASSEVSQASAPADLRIQPRGIPSIPPAGASGVAPAGFQAPRPRLGRAPIVQPNQLSSPQP